MPHFHLGVIATGGFDLGALAFVAFVIAQLLAMVLLRRLTSDAQGAQQSAPKDAQSLQTSRKDPDRITAPPIQPALQR